MTHFDCSLQVFEVTLGENIIGIAQSLDVEKHVMPLNTLRAGQHMVVTQSDTITLKVLMTREQKALYAVMQRLMKDLKLSIDMHNEGKILIQGKPFLPEETLKAFAEKKHPDNEVEFIFEGAQLSIMKERKHVKA